MKLYHLSVMLIGLMFISCSNENDEKANQQHVGAPAPTPKTLIEEDDGNKFISLKSSSGRARPDIITRLFEEALEDDKKLQSIVDHRDQMYQAKNEQTYSFKTYSKTNEDYWSTAEQYISQLNDTLLQGSMTQMFNRLQSKYNSTVSAHESKIDSVLQKVLELDDQLILIKLIVTEAMIESYQKNELPDIQPIEDLIVEYDSLIQETHTYLTKTPSP